MKGTIQNFFFNPLFFLGVLILIKIVLVLVAVAYFTLAERKIMAAIQRRKGPNVVGFLGLLQPLADGLKLICKEIVFPSSANFRIFLFAPLLVIVLSLTSWSVIPCGLFDYSLVADETLFISLSSIYSNVQCEGILDHLFTLTLPNFFFFNSLGAWPYLLESSFVANINYPILLLLAISSLNVYGIIIAGWVSNSKYAFLGALRSAAQMVSYEVSIGLVILPVVLLAGSLDFVQIVLIQQHTVWFCFPLCPCLIIFFISMLAETNRAPFDLPEAEAELVAGYNVEYSSIIFALFFLAEYSNMLLMSAILVLLFFGGWSAPIDLLAKFISPAIFFSFKIIIVCFFFILVRATFPRYRYDQLMEIGWTIFLPIALAYILFVSGVLLYFNSLPVIFEVFNVPSNFILSNIPFSTHYFVESSSYVKFYSFFTVMYLIGLAGMIFNQKNFLIAMLCMELMYLGLVLLFIFSSNVVGLVFGQVYALYIIILAAAESAVGLGLLIVLYRFKKTINFSDYQVLRG